MDYWIPRHLLTVTGKIEKDPVMLMCMQKLFYWANEMGRQGIKVSHLTVVPPRTDCCISQPCTICCKQECTEEEKEARAHQQEMIKQAALCGWTDTDEEELDQSARGGEDAT